MRHGAVLLVGLLLVGCGTPSSPTSTTPQVQSPAGRSTTTSPSPDSLPRSQTADGCVRDNRKWYQQFLDALDVDPAQAEESLSKIQEAAYRLALNAGAMEVDLKEHGPVENGDQCLLAAALALRLIAELFPPDTQWYRDTTAQALRFFRAVVTYYPDSESAADARQAISELS